MPVSTTEKQELERILRAHRQEHVLQFWDELDSAAQSELVEEARGLNLELIERLYRETPSVDDAADLAARAESPPAFRLGSPDNAFGIDEARRRGEETLAAGKLGVLIVAGGQGTRLGFDHPKGMYGIGPVSGATLFQVLFEKVAALGRRYGVNVPLYLMTSPATHEETIAFLDKHDRFGLPSDDVRIFCQGTMPAVDRETGRLLLAEKGRLFLNPDGHGGTLDALVKSGSLADIHRRGLGQVYYMQVDNPLVDIGDPAFLGYHLLSGSEVSTQVVAKRDPVDRVGNVVSVDGKVRIIEYSDLPAEAAHRRNPDGSLTLWAGNIAVHLFDVAFLDRVSERQELLPFHVAQKKVPYVDTDGQLVEPAEPNAIKFERFIFDLLPAAEHAIVVEVDAQRNFAPLKNAPGAERDSPETVKRQMIALHSQWLTQAGARVAPHVTVEISPFFALDADDVARRVQPGLVVNEPRYFSTTD